MIQKTTEIAAGELSRHMREHSAMMPPMAALPRVLDGIAAACALSHGLAATAGWWSDPHTGEPLARNDGEIIALIHSEVSEALEGIRKNSQDDHLPHRKSVEVELADALVRIFDYAGARKLDLAGAMIEKMAYNAKRADHKPESRAAAGGKKF